MKPYFCLFLDEGSRFVHLHWTSVAEIVIMVNMNSNPRSRVNPKHIDDEMFSINIFMVQCIFATHKCGSYRTSHQVAIQMKVLQFKFNLIRSYVVGSVNA